MFSDVTALLAGVVVPRYMLLPFRIPAREADDYITGSSILVNTFSILPVICESLRFSSTPRPD